MTVSLSDRSVILMATILSLPSGRDVTTGDRHLGQRRAAPPLPLGRWSGVIISFWSEHDMW